MKIWYSIFDKDPEMSVDLLGGKGYNLSVMGGLGVPVPPAVVIPTEVCRAYMLDPKGVMFAIKQNIPSMMAEIKGRLGVDFDPLVSVRSGAKFSMPGMMDTILNVGLSRENFPFWEGLLGAECASDSRARLQSMYEDVVKAPLPGKGPDQLLGAIEAVFNSWSNERARTYRKLNNIPDDLGTAVVVQAMVFGNLDDKSCTGVLFSRNPSNGANEIVGEYLVNAQGEDVVAGIRTPMPLTDLKKWNYEVATELLEVVSKLENHYRDMQDIEFTVQGGILYILQTRNGKRTAQAAVKVAVDLVEEGMISKEEAIKRVSLKQYLAAVRPQIDPSFKKKPVALGIPASNGIATGKVVFSAAEAVKSAVPCILVSEETTPDDIAGMNAAVGILTSTGGATSHAAVVARGMDKVCVVGCAALVKNGKEWFIKNGKENLPLIKGTTLSLDGSTGRVWVGEVPVVKGAAGSVSRFNDMVVGGKDFIEVVDPETKKGNYLFADMLKDPSDLIEYIGKVEYIDLTPINDLLPHEDSMLNTAFCPRNRVAEFEAVLLAHKGNGTTVFGYKCAKDVLVKAGYLLGSLAKDISSLLYGDSMSLGGITLSKDAKRILELRKKAGEKVKLIAMTDEAPSSDGVTLVTTQLKIIQSVLS